LFGDEGKFDECFGINLEIQNQWLYTEQTISSFLSRDSGVHSYGLAATKSVNKIKLNVSNVMYRNYLN